MTSQPRNVQAMPHFMHASAVPAPSDTTLRPPAIVQILSGQRTRCARAYDFSHASAGKPHHVPCVCDEHFR